MNYYLSVLKNYVKFSGRARRSEYWYFALFNSIIIMILMVVVNLTRSAVPLFLYYIAIMLPSIAVAVRRMHDVNKSGWFILIPIYNLILALTPGTIGENAYGADPKNGPAFGADDYEKPFDIDPSVQ